MDIEALGATEDNVASILRLRRARSRALGAGLFNEIGWDVLLELFAAHLGGRRVKLSDLNISAPPSAVARWVAVLEERGLLGCRLDQVNREELWLELSSAGATKMIELFRILDCRHRAD